MSPSARGRSSIPPAEPDPAEDAPAFSPRVLRGAVGVAEPAVETVAWLGVDVHTFTRTALLAGYLFVASSIFVLGRTLRDALFLDFYGPRAPGLLPWMFLAYGAASAAVAVLSSRFSDAARRDRLVVGTTLLAAGSYLVVWALLPLGWRWLPSVFYVWAELVGSLALVHFWSVANDLHDARSARRLFGFIGVGMPLGVLACGLGASSFVQEVGTRNLLLVVVLLMLVVVLAVRTLTTRFGLGTAIPGAARLEAPAALSSPYVRRLALVLLLGFVAVNIGDFQFKAAVRLAHHDQDEIARFMSLFYATLGGLAIVVQLALTPWLLRRLGVLAGALTLPLGYLLANLAALAWPSIQSLTVVKLADNALQFTVFDATLQLLYMPLPEGVRGRVRTFLEAVAKPAGYALAGALVLVLQRLHPPTSFRSLADQSYYVLPIVVLWLALLPGTHEGYLNALRQALTRRDTSPPAPLVDASTRTVLERVLTEGSPRLQVYALEQLAAHDEALAQDALEGLLRAPHPAVRAAALSWVGRLRCHPRLGEVRAHLDDPDDGCATAAVGALSALLDEDAVPELEGLLASPRAAVEDAALAAMLSRGGLEGTLLAGQRLEAWLTSPRWTDRQRAARLLADPEIRGMSRVLRRLLADPEAEVRCAALASVGASHAPKTLPLVLGLLEDPRCEKAAVRALGALGPEAVPGVVERLKSPATPRAIRLALPRALQLVATAGAYEGLGRCLDEDDEWVRQKILAAASRLRGRLTLAPLPRERAGALLRRELDRFAELLESYGPLRERLAMPLLDAWAADRLKKALLRALRVAELSSAYARAAAARDQLFSPVAARRAVALEMVSNVLDASVRDRFVAQVDALRALRTRALPAATAGAVPEARDLALALLEAPDPFARVVGLDLVQFRALEVTWVLVYRLLRDASPAVREMAALALAMRRPRGWREGLRALTADPDPAVAGYVNYVLATGRTGMEEDEAMYTTLEKLLYLQRIPLFSEVPPEHLVALARSARVERVLAEAVVFSVGDPGDALYFIIEGRVQVAEPETEPATYVEGEVFGELSVLDSAPRTAAARAVCDVVLLRIAQEDFYEVLHGTSELAEGVIHVLVRRLRASAPSG